MEHLFNASFDMYSTEGVRVRFSVGGEELPVHITTVRDYMGALAEMGYAPNPVGTEPGEKVEAVNAYVVGETSKNEQCAYLYSTNGALQFRVATVFLERLAELPFEIQNPNVWPGQAPKREMAEEKGYLVAVTDFQIVLKPTGKMTDAGNVITKFDRVHGAKPATNGTGPPEIPPEVKFQTPPETKPEQVGRWTSITAKGILAGGGSYNFESRDDAIDFGVASGAYTDHDAATSFYEDAKNTANPKSSKEMWSAWLDAVAKTLNVQEEDKETWETDEIPF